MAERLYRLYRRAVWRLARARMRIRGERGCGGEGYVRRADGEIEVCYRRGVPLMAERYRRLRARFCGWLIRRIGPCGMFWIDDAFHTALGLDEPDKPRGSTCAVILMRLAREHGHDRLVVDADSVLLNGESIGDWRVIVERLHP